MDLTRTSFMEPMFPFSFANRQLRTLRQLADQMESSFTSSDGVQHHVPTYEYRRGSDNIHLEVELPGVKQENIQIEIRGAQLRIRALRFKSSGVFVEEQKEKKQNAADNENDVKMDEGKTATMAYELQVKVGENVDEPAIKAEHQDGILRMLIPLKKMAGARRIAITQG